MTTIGEVVSRIRGQLKAEYQDSFVTDRYIYSLITKYAQFLMRRQDSTNKLMKFNSVWKSLPFVELIEVDKNQFLEVSSLTLNWLSITNLSIFTLFSIPSFES